MKKSARKNELLNKLHKGFVVTCVVVTLYGLTHLGARWYNYFTVLRPAAQKRELLEKQQMLSEGSSDVLVDAAFKLKS